MAQDKITYVYLETTNFCNLDCKFCNRRDVVASPRHMGLEDWDVVLNKLAIQPITEAKLMGLGEPFLHPQFHKVCCRFKEVFPAAFTISATNCQYKLNDNFVKALPYISLLYLSIDGYEKSYEKDRKGAKWEHLILFLDALSKIDAEKTRIAINYVATNDNYEDIPKLQELVSSKYKFIEEIRLNIAQWWNEDEYSPVVFSNEFMEMLTRYKNNVKGKAPWTFSDCFWPRTGFYMDVNGNVKICCLNTSTKAIGNIFKDSLGELLNSPKRKKVSEECASNKPGKHCRKCDYKRLSPVLERIFSAEEIRV